MSKKIFSHLFDWRRLEATWQALIIVEVDRVIIAS